MFWQVFGNPKKHSQRLITKGFFVKTFIQSVRFPQEALDAVSVNRFFKIFFGNRYTDFVRIGFCGIDINNPDLIYRNPFALFKQKINI